MTALSANYARNGKDHKMPNYPVAADKVIYQGALVMINAGGFLQPCIDEAGGVFAGISRSSVDSTGESNGDSRCDVEARDAFEVACTGMAAGDVGKVVYALDDNTVGLTQAGNEVAVGKIIEVISATKVLVLPNVHQTK